MTVTAPTINGETPTSLSDNVDADAGSFDNTVGNRVVNVNCGDLDAAESCILTYEVQMQ